MTFFSEKLCPLVARVSMTTVLQCCHTGMPHNSVKHDPSTLYKSPTSCEYRNRPNRRPGRLRKFVLYH